MNEILHHIAVWQRSRDEWQAECLCHWRSPFLLREVAAKNAGLIHVEEHTTLRGRQF